MKAYQKYLVAACLLLLVVGVATAVTVIKEENGTIIGVSAGGVIPHPNDPRPYDDVILFVSREEGGAHQFLCTESNGFNPLPCWQLQDGQHRVTVVAHGDEPYLVDTIIIHPNPVP